MKIKYILTFFLILILNLSFLGCSSNNKPKKVKTTPLGVVVYEYSLTHYIKAGRINEQDKGGNTALHHSLTNKKYLKIVKQLLKNKAKLDIVNKLGFQPIVVATLNNNLDGIKLLIKSGADIKQRDKEGNSVLYHSLIYGHLDIAKYFIQKGLSIDDASLQNVGMIKIIKQMIIVENKKLEFLHINKNGYNIKIININKDRIKDRIKQYQNTIIFINKYYNETYKIEKEQKEKAKIKHYLATNDFQNLKIYTDKNPNSVYYIEDITIRLALTGPKDMKVGDIRKLIKNKRSEMIIVSLIKRVKSPYKEFTLNEIDILSKMGLSDNIISAMIDVTTKLLENEERRKEQEFYLSEQERISKIKSNVTNKNNKKTNNEENKLQNDIQDKVLEKGMNMLFNRLF